MYSNNASSLAKFQGGLGNIIVENTSIDFLKMSGIGLFNNIFLSGNFNSVKIYNDSVLFGSKSAGSLHDLDLSIDSINIISGTGYLVRNPQKGCIYNILNIIGTGSIYLQYGSGGVADGGIFNLYSINNVGTTYLSSEGNNNCIFNFKNTTFGSSTFVNLGEQQGIIKGSTSITNLNQITGGWERNGSICLITDFYGKIGNIQKYVANAELHIINSNIKCDTNLIHTNTGYPINANAIKFIGENTFLQATPGELITGGVAITVEQRGTNAIDSNMTSIGTNVTINATIDNAGGSGGGIADLQEGYEANPTILTDATNDALKIQQGSGSDSDTIFEGLNGAGVVTSSIDGRGYSNVIGHIKRNITIGGPYALGVYVTKTTSGEYNASPLSAATALGGVLIRESYAIDGKGDILIQGTVKGLDTSSFSLGNSLYPNINTGVLTTTVPTNYTRYVQVGKVSVVDATNGEIEVDIQKGYHPIPSAAYSIVAQNGSNATGALPTNQAYRNEVEKTYTDTPTWNGTAPSGSPTNTYSFLTLGNRCDLNVNLDYPTAGATNGQVVIPLPSDAPTPKIPAGFSGNSVVMYVGAARIINSKTALPTLGVTTCYLRNNSTSTGFELAIVSSTNLAAIGAYAYINYPTA